MSRPASPDRNSPQRQSMDPRPIASERHSSSSSPAPQTQPLVSPPNQPRRSLSTQLAPDYHNWVNDVSASRPASSAPPLPPTRTPSTDSNVRPPSSGSRFMDAVTGKSKAAKGRARRENQPSFCGSTFTNSDTEPPKDQDDGDEPDTDSKVGNGVAQTDRASSRQPVIDSISPKPRLPPLSKSQVSVPDPSRPAFKLGTPIVPKQRPSRSRNSPPRDTVGSQPGKDLDAATETSALLGSTKPTRQPHSNDLPRWTNEGSRRRTPRYDGQGDADLDEIEDDTGADDSLRRPSRARSLSPNMESRRGNRGKIMFRNSQNPSKNNNYNRRANSNTLLNLRRTSLANINLVKQKFLSRKSGFYDDAKEALVKENNGIRIWYHNYTTIDWIHDFVKERVRLRHLRSLGGMRGMIRARADSLKGWVLVLLTGVITACLAAFIDVSSWWLGDLRMGYCTTNFWWSQYFCCWGQTSTDSCPEWVSWSQALSTDSVILGLSRDSFDWAIYCCFGVLFAGICVVMVTSDGTVSKQRSHGSTKRRNGAQAGGIPRTSSKTSMEEVLTATQPKKIAYFGAGSGIPEVKTILGGFVIRGFLGFRTLMIKLIGLPLMVASGLNMGKQGPLVHIACCVANIVCRIFDKYNRNDGKRREILSAAAASGVAVAFGAPIGGVLFSLEEVSYYFPSKTMWRSYFCALISAVVLKMINPYRVGKTVLFQVTYDRDWHLFEAIPFFFISVFGGAYGAIFSQFHMSYSRFRSRTWIGRHPVQEVLIVTLAEISQIYPIFLLLAQVFAVKVFLNFITFGVKVPGGIFIPTMVAGAVFGRMVGLGVQWLIAKYPEYQMFQVCEGDSMDCVIPGLYAMIGAAACLSGVTRMTVSLVVIMFELTGAMTYSLPIMMAVMIGKFVGDAFSPDAFFNKLIDLNGHPYLDNKKDYNTFGTAADIADRFLETIDVNALNDVDSLRRKVEILAVSGYSDGGLPIVDRGVLVGYIASNELGHALDLAEQKHPDCICIFRNRATSDVPATEICTSLEGLEAQAGDHRMSAEFDLVAGLTSSPTQYLPPPDSFRTRPPPFRMPDTSEERLMDHSSEFEYDSDMRGHDGAIRHLDPGRNWARNGDDKSSLGQYQPSDNKSFKSNGTDPSARAGYMGDDDSELLYPSASRRFAHNDSGRVSSTGTTDLLRDPAHTMDFTPFTDQAPLSVSLFSSMDLVMELFIKLGIKYVCVVKAGELYGMIHKKRLLSFLKENDERQKRLAQGRCF
ncbi:hypothetical protein BGZ68_009388 [Mortierella alpina]|nr:hypothetical protein BGZ68_009388 [Mortierella alpina]